MEEFLHFWLQHNAEIIQWLIVTIVALGLFVITLQIFSGSKKQAVAEANTAAATANVDLEKIEATLKKVLDNTTINATAVAAPAAGGGDGPSVISEGAAPSPELQQKLTEAESKIQELTKNLEQAQAEGGGGQEAPAAQDPGLLAKIKDLEAKLAEYEIIEDDIADLSKYKEENARLQEQLEALKAGGGAPAAAAPEPAPAAPGPEPESESFVEAVAAVEPEPEPAADLEEPIGDSIPPGSQDAVDEMLKEAGIGGESMIGEEAEASAEPEESIEAVASNVIPMKTDAIEDGTTGIDLGEVMGEVAESSGDPSSIEPIAEAEEAAAPAGPAEDLVAEFESAVNESLSQEETIAASPAETPSPAAAPAGDDLASVFEQEHDEPGDDILAEFTAPDEDEEEMHADAEESSDSEDSVLESNIDTNRMLEEMGNLEAAAANDDGSSSLDDEMDVDKMAAEATRLVSSDNQ